VCEERERERGRAIGRESGREGAGKRGKERVKRRGDERIAENTHADGDGGSEDAQKIYIPQHPGRSPRG
jgi:hypothetical protein